jgi:Tol biopolymer transport system component
VAGDTDLGDDVFVRDLQAGGTILVSTNLSGYTPSTTFGGPLISPDGRFIAFQAYGASSSVLRVVDLQNGVTLQVGTNTTSCAFSGDSRILGNVSGGEDEHPRIPLRFSPIWAVDESVTGA